MIRGFILDRTYKLDKNESIKFLHSLGIQSDELELELFFIITDVTLYFLYFFYLFLIRE